MTDDRLLDAFDDCLTRLKAGETVGDCLRAYPDLAADLRPMLDVAQTAMTVSRVPRPAQMRSRAQFLTAAAQKKLQPAVAGWWRGLSTVMALAATAVMVWLGFSVVTNTVLNVTTPTSTLTATASPTQTQVDTATAEPTATTQATTPTPTYPATPSPTASPTRPLPTASHTASPTLPTPTDTTQPTQLIVPTVEQTPVPNVTDDHGDDGTSEPEDDHGEQTGSSDDSEAEDHDGAATPEPSDDHSGGGDD